VSTYDTTTGGLANAGLTAGSGYSREDAERTRDALDDVRTTEPDTAQQIERAVRRRPAPVAAAALLLAAGAAATAILLRRRAAAKRTGWNRVLPGFLKR
jgi:hypothetical protein